MAGMKFSLRDLFWLVLVVAILVAWRIDRTSLAHRLADYETIWTSAH